MTLSLIQANRLLPLVTVLITVVSGAASLFSALPETQDARTVTLPSVSQQDLPDHTPVWPDGNPFAADGEPWILPDPGPKAVAQGPAGPGRVTGIISLPGGPQGVMVDKKFVPLGAPLAGGHLVSVSSDRYVIEIDGVTQTKLLDSSRKERLDRLLGKH